MSKIWWIADALVLAGAAAMLTIGTLGGGWSETYQANNGYLWLCACGIDAVVLALIGALRFAGHVNTAGWTSALAHVPAAAISRSVRAA